VLARSPLAARTLALWIAVLLTAGGAVAAVHGDPSGAAPRPVRANEFTPVPALAAPGQMAMGPVTTSTAPTARSSRSTSTTVARRSTTTTTVRSSASPTTTTTAPAGSTTTTTPTAAAPTWSVTPNEISAGAGEQATFAGNRCDGSRVAVFINGGEHHDEFLAVTDVDPDGDWSLEATVADPGTYDTWAICIAHDDETLFDYDTRTLTVVA
jgi:hypothetical protein